MKIRVKSTILFVLTALCALPMKAQHTGVIDKVVAVVGGEAIFLSDIEEGKKMSRAQGMLIDENSSCTILEGKLVEKLLLAQAKIDSLTVNEEAAKDNADRMLKFYIQQQGSVKAVEKYFNVPIHKVKERLLEIAKEQTLSQQMQRQIVQNVDMTPEDVTRYFKKTPKDSLPIIPDQYIIQQIVLYPPNTEAMFMAREQLLSIRERVLNGEKFSMLATMYSEDPESAKRGGELGLAPKNTYTPAFAEAASLLKVGQVSQIVETEYGLHIIQMIDKQSNDIINVRHILIRPKYTSLDQQRVSARLDSIKGLVLSDTLTFEAAALRFSQDPTSRLNGGLVVNPATSSNSFDKDQLIPADYFMLRGLKEGQISTPFESTDAKGKLIYKIIRVKEIIPTHTANAVDDFSMIKLVAEDTKRIEKFKEWINRKQAVTFIRIDPEYRSCKFEYATWVK